MALPEPPPPPPASPPGAPRKTPRWRYVVPNAITCASLTVGLVAVVQAFILHDFVESAWLVVLCVLLDKLDGTAARALRATSDIGVQLDSFSDFVTFGVAPGALLFAAGYEAHKAGTTSLWGSELGLIALGACSAIYVLCACIRLAKFNVLTENLPPGAPKVFYGLPTTFAGGLLANGYILAVSYGLGGVLEALPLIAVGLGALNLSNLPLPKLVPRKNMVVNVIQGLSIAAVYVCGLLRVAPEYLFFNVAAYALVGFGWGLAHRAELLRAKRLDPYPVD